jgi:SAM-dependent methyltransferase
MKDPRVLKELYPYVYELRQNHNVVTRWLHSRRYSRVLKVARDLAAAEPQRPLRVLEIGCGSAKLFGVLHPGLSLDYLGIDVDPRFVSVARQRFGTFSNFKMIQGSAADATVMAQGGRPDLVVALETLEHIRESDVAHIIEQISQLRPRRFVCSVPVEVGPAIWFKNVGSLASGYSRHKEYTWKETLWAGLYRLDRLPPHGTRHKGFDWRWLARTLSKHFKIVQMHKFPNDVLPAALSTSVFFVAEPL